MHKLKSYITSFFYSTILHVFMVLALMVSVTHSVLVQPSDSNAKIEPEKERPEIIQATMLDEDMINEEISKQVKAEKAEKKKRQAQIARINQERKALQREKEEAQQQKRKILAEKKAAARAKKLAKAEAEKLKSQEMAFKKAKEQADVAKKAAAEAKQALTKEREALIARKKKEEDEKKKRDAAQKKKLAAEKARKIHQAMVQKYMALLQSKMSDVWSRPPGMPEGLMCKLEIKLSDSGSVLDVQITSSSGNIAYDDSAKRAVVRAAPFELPNDPKIRKQFKHFIYRFDPDNVGS